jgi:hypothetical protein
MRRKRDQRRVGRLRQVFDAGKGLQTTHFIAVWIDDPEITTESCTLAQRQWSSYLRAADVGDVAWPQQPVQVIVLASTIRSLHLTTLPVRVAFFHERLNTFVKVFTIQRLIECRPGLVEDYFQDLPISGNAYKFTHKYRLR